MLRVVIDVQHLQPKPHLGGYRRVARRAADAAPAPGSAAPAATMYHHATTQTPRPPAPGSRGAGAAPKACRTTQTVVAASCSAQTLREQGTQVARPGLLLDCSGDRLLAPRPYVTAAQVERRRCAAALTIQRFTRGWMARRRSARLRRCRAEREAFAAAQAALAAAEAQEQRRREVARRMHPRSAADFRLLSTELEAWRLQQTAKIKAAQMPQEEEQAALQLLLAKETKLLQTIDRLRVNAAHEAGGTAIARQLDGMAAPKAWQLSNGGQVQVHTPGTVRAAQLAQLYRGLLLRQLALDERLDLLMHVKAAVQGISLELGTGCGMSAPMGGALQARCGSGGGGGAGSRGAGGWAEKTWSSGRLGKELVGLIEREVDMLNRGRNEDTLEGLRKRIASIFLNLCQNSEFNEEAARFTAAAAIAAGGGCGASAVSRQATSIRRPNGGAEAYIFQDPGPGMARALLA